MARNNPPVVVLSVLYLELQAAMEPVQPGWAAPVHCAFHLHAPYSAVHSDTAMIVSQHPSI